MPPDLEIRVLFCYSPEVLANTYNNLRQLQEDNLQLCLIAQGIFKRNVISYKVKVSLVSTIEIDNLQTQDSISYPCLTGDQIDDLAKCTTQQYVHAYPKQFGTLPTRLLTLKNANNATVLILQVLWCGGATSDEVVLGSSACIGVQENRDNTVAIGRTKSVNKMMTSQSDKILLAHEFGHLMGCYHPYGLGNGFNLNASVDSHGHCVSDPTTGEPLCGTIMSYAKEPILYYSNPNLFRYPAPYQNEPCGVVGMSEAYKTVNANIQKLAGIF